MKSLKRLSEVAVRQLVHMAEPDYPPFELKSPDGLVLTIHLFNRPEDILHLRQQAMLAEALAANRRGDSLDYMVDFIRMRRAA